MRDIKLDNTHDLAIENGDLVIIDGIQEVAQALRIALLTVRYEWFLDPTIGIPWMDGMFSVRMTREQQELEVRREALGVPGIRTVKRVTYGLDRINKAVLIKVEAQSDDGPLTEDLGV